MKNKTPKIQLFFSTLFLLLSLGVYFVLYKGVNDNDRESRTREETWQQESKRRQDIKTLDHSVKVIESERAELETHFARSSDVVPFLDTIEDVARKAGVKAEVMSVDISTNKAALNVSVKASGLFASLYKFLTLLENSPYELEFLGVDLHEETAADTTVKSVKIPEWNAVFHIKLLSFVNETK